MSKTKSKSFVDEQLKKETSPINKALHIPNDLTKLAMLELLNNRSENTLTQYNSLDELMADIKGE